MSAIIVAGIYAGALCGVYIDGDPNGFAVAPVNGRCKVDLTSLADGQHRMEISQINGIRQSDKTCTMIEVTREPLSQRRNTLLTKCNDGRPLRWSDITGKP